MWRASFCSVPWQTIGSEYVRVGHVSDVDPIYQILAIANLNFVASLVEDGGKSMHELLISWSVALKLMSDHSRHCTTNTYPIIPQGLKTTVEIPFPFAVKMACSAMAFVW